MPFTLTNFHCIHCGTKGVYRDEAGELSTQQQHYCVTCGRTFRTGAQELNDFHTKRMAELLAGLNKPRPMPNTCGSCAYLDTKRSWTIETMLTGKQSGGFCRLHKVVKPKDNACPDYMAQQLLA